MGTIPAATAAADPADEPPATWPRFHGLRVGRPYARSLGGRPDAELGAGGAGEGDQPGTLQPDEQLGIDRVAVVAVEAGAHARSGSRPRRSRGP